MDMDLLTYKISFTSKRHLTVVKKLTDYEETLVEPIDVEERTGEGIKLELAYRILEDYKDIPTSEKYIEAFVDNFFGELVVDSAIEIAPGEIEEWLDVNLDAPKKYITGQKRD